MPQTVVLNIVHPTQNSGPMRGFRYLWTYLVNGYRSDRHCQRCFYGRVHPELSAAADAVGIPIMLPLSEHFPYAYICGVASGPRKERGKRNLHLPLRYSAGRTVEVPTYNGYTVQAFDAEQIPVPPLADDWQGLARDHVRCKNFQFAVAMFGYPSAPKRGWPVPPAS